MLNYQVTYGPQQTSLRIDPNAPLFASEDGLVASLSSQECIFQIKRNGETHVMTFQVLQAMDQCREFRSLDEHVARIESTITGLAGKADAIRNVLDNLVQRGLLVSDEMFIKRLTSAPTVAAEDMRAVFIRACDRPEQLGRLLQTLIEYERRFRSGRRYVVVDDSSLPAHVDEQRDSLREFARATGCKVGYVGRAECRKLVARLAKAVPKSREIVARMLLREAHPHAQRFGGGRGWNAAMLLSAGSRLAMLDDDLRLPLRRADYVREGFDPNPATTAQARFLASIEEVFDSGQELVDDPFDTHLASCGQSLGNVIATQYPVDRTALRGLSVSRLDSLNERARIMTTTHGTYGSSRSETGVWLYALNAESRADFVRDREQYLRNVDAHSIWYSVAQTRASTVSGFTPFTFDNSMMQPPTNPVGRGEDSFAGALLRFCHPDALSLELPEAIGHVQEAARKRSEKTLAASVPRVNHFLRDFVSRQTGLFHAAEPADRLQLMADIMRDLAAARPADQISHLREYLSYVRSDLIDRTQHQIEAVPDAPVYWQADARTIVQVNARALLSNSPPRLGDWPEDIDDAGCARLLTEELTGMAEICEHWPALWQAAAEQGEKLLSSV